VTLGNVGEGRYEGLDVSAQGELDSHTTAFVNSQILSATFKSGPLTGKTPAYAAPYMHKVGVQHEIGRFKNKLAASFLAEHYSDDNNTADRKIPSYNVWDLSGQYDPQVKILDADTKLNYGVNNLFDNQYYTRVRATGIEPALERNVYAGMELVF
jgi:Fe(3+) dicitrate transport protein